MIFRKNNKYPLFTMGKGFYIVFTKHINKVRKGEVVVRSELIKSYGQLKSLLLYAFDKHDLYDFKDKGRVVIYFNYKDEIYGLLISIESANEFYSDIVLITLDKVSDRHYKNHTLFGREKYKILMNKFTLHEPFISLGSYSYLFLNEFITFKKKKINIISRNNNVKRLLRRSGYNFLKHVIPIIIRDCFSKCLNKGCFYTEFSMNSKMFMKFSIEEINPNIFIFDIVTVLLNPLSSFDVPMVENHLHQEEFFILTKDMSYKERNDFMLKYYAS